MDLAALPQQLTANRGPILATAAAGVVGLALYRRHKAGPASSNAPAQVAPSRAASAGGQTSGMYGAGSYDSTASDVYGLVQPQMESLGRQMGDLNTRLDAVPVSTPGRPAGPLAATLYGPAGTGNYVNASGVTAEVEPDGSLFGMTGEQWAPIAAKGATLTSIAGPQRWYSTQENVWQAAQNQKLATPAAK